MGEAKELLCKAEIHTIFIPHDLNRSILKDPDCEKMVRQKVDESRRFNGTRVYAAFHTVVARVGTILYPRYARMG